jgi:hypothetical protein
MNTFRYSSSTSQNLSTKQKGFIGSSILTSFPQIKLTFHEKKIDIKNYDKKDLLSIQKSLKRLIFIARGIDGKKIIFNQIKKIRYKKDPIKELERKKEIVRISDKLFQFQGDFLKIFRGCNDYFYNLAIKKFKAIDQENPILWPIDLYKKINYLSEFPQQSLLMTGLKQNFLNYKKFSSKYNKNKKYNKVIIDGQFSDAEYGLQPAVCDNCYYALSNLKSFKNSIYTTCNKVFRNETSEFKSLDRLLSFTVRDIMFVGDKQFVLEVRQNLINEIKKFVKLTELNCSIEVADDPFFIGDIDKKLFQHSFELKYEILATIPFLKKKIAIGSINFHMDTFGKAFNINNGNKKIFSGCIGIGFERLLLALYSQHGNNIKNWPKKLIRNINII